MSRYPRIAGLLAVAAVMTAAAPAAAPATTDGGPTALASKSCGVGDGRGFGTTYVRWIKAKGASCRKAKKVVRAFHACRQGAKGRCGHRVKRFKCHENRTTGVGSYDSTVKCKRGGKRIRHGYTQWT